MSYLIDFDGDYGTRYKVYQVEDDEIVDEVTATEFPHPKQILFFDSTFRYTLFGGARGGGKTEAIIWDAIFKAHKVPGCSIIIFRRTMGELESTIIDRFKKLPPGLVGIYHGSQSSEHMELENGSKIYFKSAKNEEDVRKFLSGEYFCAYFDEWSEWPYSMWKFIGGSVRNPASTDVFGNPITAQIKGCTNPGGVGGDELANLFGCGRDQKQVAGEEKEVYDPKEYIFIQSLVNDNPAYSAETPAGKDYRAMLNSMPRRIRDAWVKGLWTGFEGQYFEGYEEDVTVIHHDDFLRIWAKQYWQPVWISIDWGSTHFFYVSWHTFVTFALKSGEEIDVPFTFREWLDRGLSETALAEEIVQRTPVAERTRVSNIYLSPDCGFDNELMRGYKIGSVFVSHEMPRAEPAFNSRIDGWRLMDDLLRSRLEMLSYTISKWCITTNCQEAQQAIPQAKCDPKNDGDIEKEGNSPFLDVLDGLRYGIASHVRPEVKPIAQKIKDELIQLPRQGNSRFIRHKQLLVEERENLQPFYTHQPTRLRTRRSR